MCACVLAATIIAFICVFGRTADVTQKGHFCALLLATLNAVYVSGAVVCFLARCFEARLLCAVSWLGPALPSTL